jgi:programmed cell death protein 5
MDELEELKKRKLMELQQNQQQAQEQQQIQAQIAQMEAAVKQFLDKDALQRYGNLKIGHKEKALHILAVLAQMIEAGQIKQKITDSQFKEILKKLEPKKKEFKIKRV